MLSSQRRARQFAARDDVAIWMSLCQPPGGLMKASTAPLAGAMVPAAAVVRDSASARPRKSGFLISAVCVWFCQPPGGSAKIQMAPLAPPGRPPPAMAVRPTIVTE
jgi:hypothetical protein